MSKLTCFVLLKCFSKGFAWWRHQMETFSALLAICERNPSVTGGFDSPNKGQWREALRFSLIYAWTNGWADNRDAHCFSRRVVSGIILCMCPANKRRRYIVKSALIGGWVHTWSLGVWIIPVTFRWREMIENANIFFLKPFSMLRINS